MNKKEYLPPTIFQLDEDETDIENSRPCLFSYEGFQQAKHANPGSHCHKCRYFTLDEDIYEKSIWQPDRFDIWLNHMGFLDYDNGKWFVYFISDGEFIKIGATNNIKERLSDIQVGNARPLKVILKIPVISKNAAHQVEGKLHGIFNSYRKKGEWFDILDKLIWKSWKVLYNIDESKEIFT